MLNIFKSKFFKFATQVQPIVVHRNGNADLFGRFGRRR